MERFVLAHCRAHSGVHAVSEFGEAWIAEWEQSQNFALWQKMAASHLFDIIEPKHPRHGVTAIEDIQRRYAQ